MVAESTEPEVVVEERSLTGATGALVAIAVAEGAAQPDGDAAALDGSTGGDVARLLSRGPFKGKFAEKAILYPREGGWERVLVVGLGKPEALTVDRVRQLGARIARWARELGVADVHMPILGAGVGDVTAEAAARALAEGAVMGVYRFERYKSKNGDDGEEKRLARVVLLAQAAGAVAEAARRGATVARGVNLARDWATVSGVDALAPNLAKEVQAMARDAGLKCTVMDENRIRREGMGGVLAVNAGSAHPPRFVILEHKPQHKGKGTLVLVGKGVTFDSGGISIKPAEKMEEMKFDKSGAAAVWGAMRAIADLDLPVHVVALTPMVENLPSGTAYKPGDVYTALNGKTVEVVNTDAEGRLILADALAYAERYAPDAMVDIATLTGHVVVAFGHHCSGLMGNDDWWLEKVQTSAERVHEPVHTFPFFEDYAKSLKSEFADIKHHGGRPAGAIGAGKFLEAFVPEGVPWAHLDVAGTAHHSGKAQFNEAYSQAPATGVGVRTFVDLAEHWSLDGREKRKSTPKRAAKKTARKKTAGKKAGKTTASKKTGKKSAAKRAKKTAKKAGKKSGARRR